MSTHNKMNYHNQEEEKRKCNLSETYIKTLRQKFNFEEDEIEYLKSIFIKIAPHKFMTVEDWKKSMGIIYIDLPSVAYFATQIFKAIISNNNPKIYFEDYQNFVNILTAENIKEKAKFSFNMLDDGHKGYITESDVRKMMAGVFDLWNILTNSRIIVLDDYVLKVFQTLDVNTDRRINLVEYEKVYDSQQTVFGWFEYLNQDEDFLNQIKEKTKKEIAINKKLKKTKGELAAAVNQQKEIDFSDDVSDNSFISKTIVSNKSNRSILETKKLESQFTIVNFLEQQDKHIELENTYNNVNTYNRPKCDIKGPSFHLERNNQEGCGLPKGDFLDASCTFEKEFEDLENFFSMNGNKNLIKQNSSYSSPTKSPSQSRNFLSAKQNSSFKMERNFNRQVTVRNIEDTLSNIKSSQEKMENATIDCNESNLTKSQVSVAKKRKRTKEYLQKLDFEKKKKEHFETKRNLGVFFGHEHWNLILNIMIGIRSGLKSIISKKSLIATDFKMQVRHDLKNFTFDQKFDKKNKFLLFEYAPHVFDNLREIIGLTSIEFLRSIGPENIQGNLLLGSLHSLTELASAGKSGSLFYLTPDNKFFIKTISFDEFETFLSVLKEYYNYLSNNENSLIYKVVGLYKIECYIHGKDETMYVCVMQNIFWCGIKMHKIYDLKGSTYHRTSRKKDGTETSSVLKDLDWIDDKQKIIMDAKMKKLIFDSISSDSKFLKEIHVMDYSFLIGIHNIPKDISSENYLNSIRDFADYSNEYLNGQKKPKIRDVLGGFLSADDKNLYFIAIIDIFTKYTSKKRAEHILKLPFQGKGISCADPADYSNRFFDFLVNQI